MPRKREIDIRFPLGGLNRYWAHSQQKPYTTPDCSNVRPDETIEGRERGGSRPGLAKFSPTELGSGAQVNGLSVVELGSRTPTTTFSEAFSGSSIDTSNWDKLTYYGTVLDYPSVTGGYSYATPVLPYAQAAIAKTITGFSLTNTRTCIATVEWTDTANQQQYDLLIDLDSTTPSVETDGIRIVVYKGDRGAGPSRHIQAGVTIKNGGVALKQQTFPSTATPAYISSFGSSGKIVATIGESILHISVYDGAGAPVLSESMAFSGYSPKGSRFGFIMWNAVSGYDEPRMHAFSCEYIANTGPSSPALYAASGGTSYYRAATGAMTSVSSSLTISTTTPVMCATGSNRVYILDHGTPSGAETYTTTSGTYANLGATPADRLKFGATDYTALGLDTSNWLCEISASSNTSELPNAVYKVTAIHATNGLQLTSFAAAVPEATGDITCTFRLYRRPKMFTVSTLALAEWVHTSGKGEMPPNCNMLVRYRDRAVLAGDPWFPHAVFASRQGDWTDFDYGADVDDPGKAWALTTAQLGEMAAPVTALIPGRDDYLLVSGWSSLWVMRGDPSYGGALQNVSDVVGCISRLAWCEWSDGSIYFLSRAGLYALAPDAQGKPVAISSEVIPDELLNIDTSVVEPVLVTDLSASGIHIFLTRKNSSAATTGWFVSLPRGTFWPTILPNTLEPVVACNYPSPGLSDSDVVMGCRDGYLRSFRQEQEDDDGTAFTSYVDYGPIPMGGQWTDAVLNQLVATLDDESADVTLTAHVGDTPEAAKAAAASFTSTLSAGIGKRIRSRCRGAWLVIRLTSTSRWAIEQIQAELVSGGNLRVR